ncbi:unnamed protein product [Amoebophrya sp. A120]|nr:unnamed protein product [Amoebophrya sp. A120]|eukprot:GSA120T00024173001.1
MDPALGDFLNASGSSEEETAYVGSNKPKSASNDPYASISLSTSSLRRSGGGLKARSPGTRSKMQGRRTSGGKRVKGRLGSKSGDGSPLANLTHKLLKPAKAEDTASSGDEETEDVPGAGSAKAAKKEDQSEVAASAASNSMFAAYQQDLLKSLADSKAEIERVRKEEEERAQEAERRKQEEEAKRKAEEERQAAERERKKLEEEAARARREKQQLEQEAEARRQREKEEEDRKFWESAAQLRESIPEVVFGKATVDEKEEAVQPEQPAATLSGGREGSQASKAEVGLPASGNRENAVEDGTDNTRPVSRTLEASSTNPAPGKMNEDAGGAADAPAASIAALAAASQQAQQQASVNYSEEEFVPEEESQEESELLRRLQEAEEREQRLLEQEEREREEAAARRNQYHETLDSMFAHSPPPAEDKNSPDKMTDGPASSGKKVEEKAGDYYTAETSTIGADKDKVDGEVPSATTGNNILKPGAGSSSSSSSAAPSRTRTSAEQRAAGPAASGVEEINGTTAPAGTTTTSFQERSSGVLQQAASSKPGFGLDPGTSTTAAAPPSVEDLFGAKVGVVPPPSSSTASGGAAGQVRDGAPSGGRLFEAEQSLDSSSRLRSLELQEAALEQRIKERAAVLAEMEFQDQFAPRMSLPDSNAGFVNASLTSSQVVRAASSSSRGPPSSTTSTARTTGKAKTAGGAQMNGATSNSRPTSTTTRHRYAPPPDSQSQSVRSSAQQTNFVPGSRVLQSMDIIFPSTDRFLRDSTSTTRTQPGRGPQTAEQQQELNTAFQQLSELHRKVTQLEELISQLRAGKAKMEAEVAALDARNVKLRMKLQGREDEFDEQVRNNRANLEEVERKHQQELQFQREELRNLRKELDSERADKVKQNELWEQKRELRDEVHEEWESRMKKVEQKFLDSEQMRKRLNEQNERLHDETMRMEEEIAQLRRQVKDANAASTGKKVAALDQERKAFFAKDRVDEDLHAAMLPTSQQSAALNLKGPAPGAASSADAAGLGEGDEEQPDSTSQPASGRPGAQQQEIGGPGLRLNPDESMVETLMRGYEKENEKLVVENRELRKITKNRDTQLQQIREAHDKEMQTLQTSLGATRAENEQLRSERDLLEQEQKLRDRELAAAAASGASAGAGEQIDGKGTSSPSPKQATGAQKLLSSPADLAGAQESPLDNSSAADKSRHKNKGFQQRADETNDASTATLFQQMQQEVNRRTAQLEREVQHLTTQLVQAQQQAAVAVQEKNRFLRKSLDEHPFQGESLGVTLYNSTAGGAGGTSTTSAEKALKMNELLEQVKEWKEKAESFSAELQNAREAKKMLEGELVKKPALSEKEMGEQKKLWEEATEKKWQIEKDEMQAKLQWYIESQLKMDEDRAKAKALEEENRSLKKDSRQLRQRLLTGRKADVREKELLKQIEELQALVKKKLPQDTSILHLLAAVDTEKEKENRKTQSEREQGLEEENVSLKQQLEDKEVDFDRRLRALRAQYDKLQYEMESAKYRERMTGGAAGGSSSSGSSTSAAGRMNIKSGTTSGASGHTGTNSNDPHQDVAHAEQVWKARIKDLEKQLEHQKSYYLGKLRSKDPLVPQSAPLRANAAHSGAPGAKRVLDLEEALAQAERRLQEAEVRNRDLVLRLNNDDSYTATPSRKNNKRGYNYGNNAISPSAINMEVEQAEDGTSGMFYDRSSATGSREPAPPRRSEGQEQYTSARGSSYPPKKVVFTELEDGYREELQGGITRTAAQSQSIKARDFLQFTPSLMRKFLAQPFALCFGILEKAASDLLEQKSYQPPGTTAANVEDVADQEMRRKAEQSQRVQDKNHLLAFVDALQIRRKQAADAGPYPTTEFLQRVRVAIEKNDLPTIRSLLDQALLQKLSVAESLSPETEDTFGRPPAIGEQTLAFALFAERWRENRFVAEDFPILEQDLKVHHSHHGLSIPWFEFLKSVQRCGPWGPELKQLQEDAALLCVPGGKVFWPELRTLLLQGATPQLGSFASVLHPLRKLKDSNKWQELLDAFRLKDPSCSGTVSRQDFLDIFQSKTLNVAQEVLTPVEVETLTLFFGRSKGQKDVEWLLLLQDLLQQGSSGEQIWSNFFNSVPGAGGRGTTAPGDHGAPNNKTRQTGSEMMNYGAQQDGQTTSSTVIGGPATQADLATKTELTRMTLQNAELVRQKDRLQQDVKELQDKNDSLAQLVVSTKDQQSSSVPQQFRQLASTVALLEKQLLQKTQAMQQTAKKKEITLETELEIQKHEIFELKKLLGQKENQLAVQREEVDAIVRQMRALKPPTSMSAFTG